MIPLYGSKPSKLDDAVHLAAAIILIGLALVLSGVAAIILITILIFHA